MSDGSVFARDTRIEPLGAGRFAGQVSHRFCGLAGNPLGGYVLAIALRALGAALPLPDPMVVSAFFLEPVAPGPVELHTRVLRAGRRTATGEVVLLQSGREALRATATFADLATLGPTSGLAGGPTGPTGPPVLPPPEESIGLYADGSVLRAAVADQVEFRVARLPGWRTGAPSGDPRSEFWMRVGDGGDADPLLLAFLVDAAPPAVLELGAVGTTTLQLTLHLRARPGPGWFACRAGTRFLTDAYHEEDFEVWDEQGRLVAQSRQLALLRR